MHMYKYNINMYIVQYTIYNIVQCTYSRYMYISNYTPSIVLIQIARLNYIASNLQNSQVEVCFYALRNTPVELAKVYYYYLDSFPIYTHCTHITSCNTSRNNVTPP